MTREQLIAGKALSGLTWDELCLRAGTTRNTTWRWMAGRHTGRPPRPIWWIIDQLKAALEAEGVVFYPAEGNRPATVGLRRG